MSVGYLVEGVNYQVPDEWTYRDNFGLYRRRFHDLFCRSVIEFERSKTGRNFIYEKYEKLGSHVLEFGITPDLICKEEKVIMEVTITTVFNGSEKAIKRKRFSYECLGRHRVYKEYEFLVKCWNGEPLDLDFPDRELLEEWFVLTTQLELEGCKPDDYLDFDLAGANVELKHPQRILCDKLGLPPPDVESEDHEGYVDYLAKKVIESMNKREGEIDSLPWNGPVDPEPFESGIRGKYADVNYDKLPKILQLGLPSEVLEEEPLNHTDPVSERVVGGVFGSLSRGSKLVGRKLEDQFQGEAEREGPGKKKHHPDKLLGPMDRKPPTQIGLDGSHQIILEDLLCELDGSLRDKESHVSFALRFYSRLSREIVMNSMNKLRRTRFCHFSSGFKGVSVLLAPGPLLRTESNVMFVKLCSQVSGLLSPLSHSWDAVGDHFESKWLSVDTERLNSWTRSYEKVKMAFDCLCEAVYKPGEVLLEVEKREENLLNPALLSLIMLEDKLTTSQTIENSRYIMMKSLGDKRVVDLIAKFPERVTSVLQARITLKIIDFVKKTLPRKTTDILKLERRFSDQDQKRVLGLVPRLVLNGPDCHLNLTVNEIYLGCMYNVNRQNKTQDSFQILKKILKLEDKMTEELNHRTEKEKSSHLFGIHSWEDDVRHCLSGDPEEHYYSIQASRIGHKLLCESNKGFYSRQKMNKILDKTLDQFATFKASVEDIVEEISREGEILDRAKVLGVRSKCVVYSDVLCSLGNLTLRDVVYSEARKDGGFISVLIQIFKKNQWGGVREVLIMKMASRICVHFCESVSRLLCEEDEREMLTCGSGKQSSMRQDHDDLLKENPQIKKPLMVRRSADMTKWCQKFVNWIFSPLYDNIPDHDVASMGRCIVVSHMQKRIEYPRELVKMWLKYPDLKHNERALQSCKEKFLKDMVPQLINISNMGQGLYHFSSSALALACTEFSNRLFERVLKKLGLEQCIFWKTRKSSDDIGEQIILDTDDKSCLTQLWAFMMARRWANRLFSMEESIKTASGLFLYEFNSTFMMNTDCLTPTIKYALTSCGQMNTDSFTESVSESYSRIRQLFENGGSLDLCRKAHELNSDFLHMVFNSGPGMVNDPELLTGVPRHSIPYDLGVYPIFDTSLMVTMGPEWYNCRLVQLANPEVMNLYKVLYGSVSSETVSHLFSHDEEDDVYWNKYESVRKRNPLRIPQGFVEQLQSIKRRVSFNSELLSENLITNYLLLIRDPVNHEEARFKIQLKLIGLGARKAMRRTSEVIYLGRTGAFVSSLAFDGKLYRDYLIDLIEKNKNCEVDLEKWFPRLWLYTTVQEEFMIQSKPRKRITRSPTSLNLSAMKFPQWAQFRNYFYVLIGVIEETDELINLELFKSFFPFQFDSLEQFDHLCRINSVEPASVLSDAVSQFEVRKTKTLHAVTMCGSTTTLSDTLINMRRFCQSVDKIYRLEDTERVSDPYQLVCDLADSVVLELKGLRPVNKDDERRFCELFEFISREQVPMSNMMKKALTLVILRFAKTKDRGDLIKCNRLSLSWYLRSQRKNGNSWEGDLQLCIKRRSMISVCEKDGVRFVEIYNRSKENLSLLKTAINQLGWDLEDICQERHYRVNHMILVDGKLRMSTKPGLGLAVVERWSNHSPQVPLLSHLEFKINGKEQVVVSNGLTDLFNYSVKIIGTSSGQVGTLEIEKAKLLEEILKLMRQPEQPEEVFDEPDGEDWDLSQEEEFRKQLVMEVDDIPNNPELMDLANVEDTLESFDYEEFGGFLPDDYVSGLEMIHGEKWTMKSYLSFLENCLFFNYEDDKPSELNTSEVLAKINFLFVSKKTDGDDYMYEQGVKNLFEYYCLKLGIDFTEMIDHLNETIEATLPCSLGRHLSGDFADKRKMRLRFGRSKLLSYSLERSEPILLLKLR